MKERKRKPLVRISSEAVEIALIEIRREETRMRSSAKYRLSLKLSTFHSTIALQRCKSKASAGWRGRSASIRRLINPAQFRKLSHSLRFKCTPSPNGMRAQTERENDIISLPKRQTRNFLCRVDFKSGIFVESKSGMTLGHSGFAFRPFPPSDCC